MAQSPSRRESCGTVNALAAVFPGICVLCRRRSHRTFDLCLECELALERNDRACPVCAEPTSPGSSAGEICGSCIVAPPPWTATVAPFVYSRPLTGIVEGLKSGNGLRQARVLGPLLAPLIQAYYGGRALPSVLIPMPLTRKRLRQRGFNQAELLAGAIGRALGLPIRTGRLVRTRDAPAQRTLPRSARLRNVRGAFAVRRPWLERVFRDGAARLPGRVALVDDVTTTGATVRVATQALLAADVAEVHIWVAAKTPAYRDAPVTV